MKVSTLVKRALALDVEYLKRNNTATMDNIDDLLEINSIHAPIITPNDVPKLIQDVVANHDNTFIWLNESQRVSGILIKIVQTAVDEEYSRQVANYR